MPVKALQPLIIANLGSLKKIKSQVPPLGSVSQTSDLFSAVALGGSVVTCETHVTQAKVIKLDFLIL